MAIVIPFPMGENAFNNAGNKSLNPTMNKKTFYTVLTAFNPYKIAKESKLLKENKRVFKNKVLINKKSYRPVVLGYEKILLFVVANFRGDYRLRFRGLCSLAIDINSIRNNDLFGAFSFPVSPTVMS